MTSSKILSAKLIDQLLPEAVANPRARINYNIHDNYQETVQRFLNVISYSSYVQPHYHNQPGAWEGFVLLRGRLAVLQFDHHGSVVERTELSEQGPVYGIELDATSPHCITALSEFAVVFEYKQGPYSPDNDKTFNDWAPAEQDNMAALYSQWLKSAMPGDRYRVLA